MEVAIPVLGVLVMVAVARIRIYPPIPARSTSLPAWMPFVERETSRDQGWDHTFSGELDWPLYGSERRKEQT